VRRAVVFALCVLFALVLAARSAEAHKPSDSYLTLEVDRALVHARWDVALRDLDYALDLDADGDGKITWREVREHEREIVTYVLARLSVRGGTTPCAASAEGHGVAIAAHSDGSYAVVRFDLRCTEDVRALGVDYRLFFDLDPHHRGILRIDAGGSTRTHTVSARDHEPTFDLDAGGSTKAFARIVREGVLHIWQGYDHVLFLLALLLPSVLARHEGARGIGTWQPIEGLRPALVDVLRIVTAFTVAHSITLSLAALGIVTLPSRLVESAIAASVVLAAANNLHPILRQDRWMAAFLLGLMHGFGFSSTLQDLDLPRSNLLATLFGFNLGVEIGQVAIVLVFVPLAFAARKTVAYRRVALVGGSIVIAVLATIWLVERAFLVKIIS